MSKASKLVVLGLSAVVVLFAVIGGMGVHAATNDGAYRELQVFSEVLTRIRSEYVEEPNVSNVTNGALHGLLESLDPNSSYLSPAEYKYYKQHKNDQKSSIGAVISKRFGYADVVAVMPNGPAAKAGMLSGDIIEAIGDKTTRESSLEEIHTALAGEPGTTVSLQVVRIGKPDPLKFTIARAAEVNPPASSKMLEDGVGYIKVDSLPKGKSEEIAAKVKALEKENAKKLVLDLRDVAAGDEQEGIATANLFLNHGVITYLEGQKFPRQTFAADPAKAITTLPMAVLVNRGTSGAAEVVAASLLENARADVVGDKTFGDGTVQNLFEAPDGAALLLSVAKYYTPGGKAIQDEAVTPNVLAPMSPDPDEEDGAPPAQEKQAQEKPQNDTQLKRALEVLKMRGQQAKAATSSSS